MTQSKVGKSCKNGTFLDLDRSWQSGTPSVATFVAPAASKVSVAIFVGYVYLENCIFLIFNGCS